MENLTILDEFQRVINKYEDPRTKDWYLMQSPIPTLIFSFMFIISVKILIPNYMKHRKPYQFQNFIIFYNGLQVLFSAWLVYEFLSGGWFSPSFNGKCLLPRRGNSNLMVATYLYFLSKFTEFADTVLFALRKKDNQITLLHLYHHGSMPLGAWLGVKYGPDSPMTFLGMINSFVHIIMYLYYMLSAMGPNVQKYLWWKKYLTVIQLIQFVITMSHSVLTLMYGCNMPAGLSWFNITQSLVFFLMFFNFYMQSYKKKSGPSNGVAKGASPAHRKYE